MSLELKDKIKELRKSKNLTQEEFGKKLGVNKACVSRWENGTRKPTESNLKEIASMMNQEIKEFKGESTEDDQYECLECHFKTTINEIYYCPRCGVKRYQIDLNKSEQTILEYFYIDKLIRHEEEKIMYPYLDLTKRNTKKIDYHSTNKEEDNAIRYALASNEIKRLEEIKNKMPILLHYLSDIEREVIVLLYKTSDFIRKSYKQVHNITMIDYEFIKKTDIKLKQLVGQYFQYKVVES